MTPPVIRRNPALLHFARAARRQQGGSKAAAYSHPLPTIVEWHALRGFALAI
jgi:hypothetical protein